MKSNDKKLLEDPQAACRKKSAGPPNRMNDLSYREWMKFQKSFFRYSSIQEAIDRSIEFFTKEFPGPESPSKSLIARRSNNIAISRSDNRELNNIEFSDPVDLLDKLAQECKRNVRYDYAVIDFHNDKHVEQFMSDKHTSRFTDLLVKLMHENAYFSIFMMSDCTDTFPWTLAQKIRPKLRLRDERIGINNPNDDLLYELIFQSREDERQAHCRNDVVAAMSNLAWATYIIPKSPPRSKREKLHPAKFPEVLIEYFIQQFTQPGDNVLDPMAGTGSSIMAALNINRNGYGIELSEEFAHIASKRINDKLSTPSLFAELNTQSSGQIVSADCRDIQKISAFEEIQFDYIVTSPPYWSMLRNKGSENQRKRREQNLKLHYSDDEKDLGNIEDYDQFVDALVDIYIGMAPKLVTKGVLTIIVKNVKRNQVVYPLAWDLVCRLSADPSSFKYLGCTLWCQDDVTIKPFAVGIHWTSNTLHQYCLHFERT